MLYRKYKDFYEAYIGINQGVLLGEVEGLNNSSRIIIPQGLHIETQSTSVGILDLGDVGYSSLGKWSKLISTYLGDEKILELQNLGVNNKTSVGFNFRHKTTGNGNCLLSMTLTREKSNIPWENVAIFWRAAEIPRRWAADLFLIARMIELIPDADPKNISLIIALPQVGSFVVPALVDSVLGLDWGQIPRDSKFHLALHKRRDKYYTPGSTEVSKYRSELRMIRLYKEKLAGKPRKKLMYEDCKLRRKK